MTDSLNEKTSAPPASGVDPFLHRTGRRVLRVTQWASLVVCIAMAVYTITPLGNWLGLKFVVRDPLAKADFIVILGGGPERAVEAARLFREGWAPRVIISSHNDGTDFLAETAVAYGVPRDQIVFDRNSIRTADHPDNVAKLPAVDRENSRIIIVTSPYHTLRSRDVFLKAGYRHLIVRSPDWRFAGSYCPPPGTNAQLSSLPELLHEMFGWIYYRMKGWV